MRLSIIDGETGANQRWALFQLSGTGLRTLLKDFGFHNSTPDVKHEPLGQLPVAVGPSGVLM